MLQSSNPAAIGNQFQRHVDRLVGTNRVNRGVDAIRRDAALDLRDRRRRRQVLRRALERSYDVPGSRFRSPGPASNRGFAPPSDRLRPKRRGTKTVSCAPTFVAESVWTAVAPVNIRPAACSKLIDAGLGPHSSRRDHPVGIAAADAVQDHFVAD